MKLKYLSIIVVSICLTACDQSSTSSLSTSTDSKEFEAFLKLKRIPMNDKTRYERMKGEYQRRAALADEIEKTDRLDAIMVAAELEEFRKELLISRYFEQYLDESVTEQGVQNYYSSHADAYKSTKAHVAHIMFRINSRMDDIARQAVLTTALDARSKLTTGVDFSELAKAVSEDKVSAAKGGDLGWINEGAISAAFSEKAFAMKAGEVSDPFLSDYGFHIIKMIEEPQEVTKPLEAVKGDIRYQLRHETKTAEIQRLLDQAGYPVTQPTDKSVDKKG